VKSLALFGSVARDEEILWKTSQEDIPRMILLLREMISDQQSM
jgi:predicted nucleotidyltransferase